MSLTRLVSNAQRHLGNALVGVDHLLQAVPSPRRYLCNAIVNAAIGAVCMLLGLTLA